MRGTRQNKINTRSLGIIICIYATIIINIRKNTCLLSAFGKNSPSNWPRAPPGTGTPNPGGPTMCGKGRIWNLCHISTRRLSPHQRCKKWQTRQIYLCYFFQLVLIFEKATCKIMQALVPAAPVLHTSSANNASAISNSAVNISAISTSATQ